MLKVITHLFFTHVLTRRIMFSETRPKVSTVYHANLTFDVAFELT